MIKPMLTEEEYEKAVVDTEQLLLALRQFPMTAKQEEKLLRYTAELEFLKNWRPKDD